MRPRPTFLIRLMALGLLALAALAVAAANYLGALGVTPTSLARYVGTRAAGHGASVTWTGQMIQKALLAVDRHAVAGGDFAALTVGASAEPVPPPAAGRAVAVAGAAQLRAAIDGALPGDVITLAPGVYRIGDKLAVRAPGSAASPVTVRADRPGSAVIEFDAVEGFALSAPHWRFENLTIRGACADHGKCEHAFHVTGGAHHFSALNNTVIDFNAQFKINGEGGRFPDSGVIEGNTISNSTVRRTGNPVTPIDLVGASNWTIRRNLIADFVKQGGDQISYGAYAKGAGTHNLFEQNIVWCERRLQGEPGQRVGLSLGGGGSGAPYCRDGKCIVEQDGSIIASNLIASCSDDGIYLNNAARSRLIHNTVVGTAGLSVRFAGSSADIEGNLVDGPIRTRDGAIARDTDNLSSAMGWRYLGLRSVRDWQAVPPRRKAAAGIPADLCGNARPATPSYGAIEDFSACRTGASAD
jgi:parallel beta-helix repeat protein